MEIGSAVLLFFCTFVNVFLLGIQSRNVVGGRYIAAVITSFGISIANFTFIHFAATGSLVAFWVSAAGGCLGIAGAIWFYPNVIDKPARIRREREESDRRATALHATLKQQQQGNDQ